jgi:PAS domain S-box-containing protein
MTPTLDGPPPSRRGDFTQLLNRSTVSAAVLAAAIFASDLASPAGTAVGPLYALPLLVGTLSGPPRFQFVAAGVASILTIAGGLAAARTETAPLTALANRAITLTLVWTTAIVLARFRGTWLALQARTKDLADVNFAIDHSAIVAVTDVHGTITGVNQKFCDISKYAREELIGQDHRMLNSGYHPKEFIRNLWVTIANGQIWHGEIRNRAKDGSYYWVDTTIVPFLNARGKPYQYMAIRYEITERKRSEELLREQAALARLGQMAAVVAHEVKNPIAGIRGALQVISSRMPAESRDRPVMSDIVARLDALNGIVQDLLVFARPRPLRAESVDLKALVATTAEFIRKDPTHVGVRVTIDGPDAHAEADAEQLQLVFQNVLMNAAQAMGGTGDIEVTVRREPPAATPGAAPDRWTIAFADHGPGMPPEVRDKAFDAFFTTKHRGTGLGLAIARRIVDAHGGEIHIGTSPNGGTLVSISLPATRPEGDVAGS